VAERIYLLQDDGSLQAMDEVAYDSEDLLQRLLERYPDLLAGDQMNEAEPRRWLLVSREMGVPDAEGGGSRWSLDHLFLDQDAVPTLVEVKRSGDTRIRREVVGQMLDYAANAVVHWPVETLRASFIANNEDADQQIVELIRDTNADPDVETFWRNVKTNLQAGRIRMVFVADRIPAELRRVIEFLNEQMDPAEVLAVEVRQFVGDHLKSLVPKVVGRTAAAERKQASTVRAEQWTEERFFEALAQNAGPTAVTVARRILEWIRPRVTEVWFGRGRDHGSFVSMLELGGGRARGGLNVHFFAVWTYGTVEVYFQWLQGKPPFDAPEKRRELLDRLNAIPGVDLPPDSITRRPTFPLDALHDDDAFRQFTETIAWGLDAVKRSAGS
jgi:hypothetical protein